MKIHDVEQNTIEWMQLHVGLPTASGLDNLLTPEFELRKGETPKTYVYKKVAEAWRGKPQVDLGASSFAMEQGLILESEAIPFWELTTGRKITRVGFITTDDGRFGCSPDGILLKGGDDIREAQSVVAVGNGIQSDKPVRSAASKVLSSDAAGIEIKCPSPHVHVKYLSEGVIPKEYRAQVYGGMFATGFKKWVFMSYCRGFPPLILEVLGDQHALNCVSAAVTDFHLRFIEAKKSIEEMVDRAEQHFYPKPK